MPTGAHAQKGIVLHSADLRGLGISVSAASVRAILIRHGLPPAPQRDALSWLPQLAHDPKVTPAWVLAGQAEDQLPHLTPDRRPPWAPVRIGPAARDHPTVPTQQRLRPHREGVPAAPRQQPAQRRKQQPIVRLEARPADLPPKNRQLMPEHENLQFLRPVTPGEGHDQLQQPADDDVQR
jgi:hypothetical protein